MIRNPVRLLAALALTVLVALGAAACSGSDGASPADTTTTVRATTATTNAALGDLSDLDGGAKGLSGGALDCYNVQLAFVALQTLPLGVLGGSDQGDLDQLRRDVETLKAQVPAAIASDFETYAAGVQAYGEALKGIDLTNLSDPATMQKIDVASQELESSEMTAAADSLEQYFATTCPAPTTTTSLPS
jgi:outer membrane murein-binding lipoprotein Lpp